MGANQSGQDKRDTRNATGVNRMKACYYEILGVERGASGDEIKKAYRRKALELHPDRNFGDVDNATSLFAEVQAAYEILSDPQERAWYDSHRDLILRGGDDGLESHYEYDIEVTTVEDLMSLFTRLNKCKEYSDSQNGFFGILRHVFENLSREEDAASHWEGLDPVDYPSFGHADDIYHESVRSFYSTWSGFATKKSFAWKDRFRYSDAPDRRIRRMMEKENKRFRDEAIREFNETVRSLVAFARKRDPRYAPNSQTEAERQKVLRDTALAQAARSRAANLEKLTNHVEPEWSQSRGEDDIGSDSEEDNDTDQEIFYECVACNKTFKSENQLQAHEKSKKHMKSVRQLRKKMEKEDRDFGLSHQTQDISIIDPADTEMPANSIEDSHGTAGSGRRSDTGVPDGFPAVIDPEYLREGPDCGSLDIARRDKDPLLSNRCDSSMSVTSDDEYAPRTHGDGHILSHEHDGNTDQSITVEEAKGDTDFGHNSTSQRGPPKVEQKLGKAKEKRAKRAARLKTEDSTANLQCTLCKTTFSSRTKLFSHIDMLNHAQPVPEAATKSRSKKRN